MPEPDQLQEILESLAKDREALRQMREIILANTVLFGEIPAPTGGEEPRIRFLLDRFRESNLQNISVDEAGNGAAFLPGRKGERNILMLAHTDTVFDASVRHTVTVKPDHLTGPGVGDNSLGVAVIASMPGILERLGIALDSNLILLGVTRSLGRGDLAGIRFFLDNSREPVNFALCVEGTHLGRLSYSALGMLRGEITCRSRQEKDWERYGVSSAIIAMNKLVSKILAIPTPREPKTSIVLGSIRSGAAFSPPSPTALLRFEVRSEQSGMVSQIQEQIEELVEELNSNEETAARLEVISRRSPGGIPFGHPLVKSARRIMEPLGIKAKVAPSVGDLSPCIVKGIPGVTLGVTTGENKNEIMETIHIEPIFSGLAQILGLLKAMDGGCCDG